MFGYFCNVHINISILELFNIIRGVFDRGGGVKFTRNIVFFFFLQMTRNAILRQAPHAPSPATPTLLFDAAIRGTRVRVSFL